MIISCSFLFLPVKLFLIFPVITHPEIFNRLAALHLSDISVILHACRKTATCFVCGSQRPQKEKEAQETTAVFFTTRCAPLNEYFVFNYRQTERTLSRQQQTRPLLISKSEQELSENLKTLHGLVPLTGIFHFIISAVFSMTPVEHFLHHQHNYV